MSDDDHPDDTDLWLADGKADYPDAKAWDVQPAWSAFAFTDRLDPEP